MALLDKKKKESKKVKKKERQIFQVGHMDLDQKNGKVEMSMQLGKWARKGKQGKEYSELRKLGDRGR